MRDPGPPQQRFAKTNRTCHCCGGGKDTREHRPSPTPGDPHYKIAVCPKCDLTPAPTIAWPQQKPPAAGSS